jgi:arylsulfatase A-like enzyme
MAGRKSLILITVDCMRADHCGFMGYERPTTPFLDGLAAESFVFPTAIVAGVPTYYSFPAIMASRYPLALGREVLGLAVEEKNLASVCKENGYATGFFGAGNPYLSARFGYDFGFDAFHDFLDGNVTALSDHGNASEKRGWTGGMNNLLERVSHRIPGVGAVYDELYFQYCQRWAAPPVQSLDMLRRFPAADVIVDQARSWLASVGENPFFLWLHFMDPHSPYYPTEKGLQMLAENGLTASRARYLNGYWNRFEDGSKRLWSRRNEVIGMYDAGVRWVDAQTARLVEVLRRLKLWENCVLAFTADHGEEFLEHGRRYHAPSLVEKLIHVPLVIRAPGAGRGLVSAGPFSLLHLAPTLLEAAELPVPAEFQGQSHWKHLREGTAWGELAISECVAGCTNPFRPEGRRGARLLAVREARYKLLLNFDTQSDQLFDLETDPEERAPLPDLTAKPERRRLLEFALAHLRKSSARQRSAAYLRTRLREIDFNRRAAAAATSGRVSG